MGNRLTQIATRTGDAGTTGLGDNTRVSKDSLRVHAMGDVDELNSHIGVLLCEDMGDDVRTVLVEIQHQLFNLGGELSIPGYELLKPEAVLALDEAAAPALSAQLQLKVVAGTAWSASLLAAILLGVIAMAFGGWLAGSALQNLGVTNLWIGGSLFAIGGAFLVYHRSNASWAVHAIIETGGGVLGAVFDVSISDDGAVVAFSAGEINGSSYADVYAVEDKGLFHINEQYL